MESIIHVKLVTGWVSYFYSTKHKVPSKSLKVQLPAALFSALSDRITIIRDVRAVDTHSVPHWVKLQVSCLSVYVTFNLHVVCFG